MHLLIQDDMWWGTNLRLPSWAGYQSRLGPYGSKDKLEPSDGSVALIFAPEGRGLEPLNERETHLFAWFEQNEPSVSEAVKEGIIQWCSPQARERASNFDFDDDFPLIVDEKDLKKTSFVCGEHPSGGCRWGAIHGFRVRV